MADTTSFRWPLLWNTVIGCGLSPALPEITIALNASIPVCRLARTTWFCAQLPPFGRNIHWITA